MRVAFWHGWLLDGTGSNIYTSRAARAMRAAGHDVLIVCQDARPERTGYVDAWGTVSAEGVSPLHPTGVAPGAGRAVVLRPQIGDLLPVFVLDEYPGFVVKRFVDLTDEELRTYLRLNAEALARAVEWHASDAVIAGHAIPGPSVARMALGPGRYSTKVHGSDMVYAMREDARYRDLAREGLTGSVAVTGTSRDVLARTAEFVPEIRDRIVVVPPGVETERFHPRPRRDALLHAAARLEEEASTAGRPAALDSDVEAALAARDASAIQALAARYDHREPDPNAPERLRALAGDSTPLVGYIGKLIPQKGVDLLLQALALLPEDAARGLVIGFGSFREWLTALAAALRGDDADALAWLDEASELTIEPPPAGAPRSRPELTFTGRLDHQHAPEVLSALTTLVVPSILDEAFGMVAVEGAASGALPLVSRHSGLAEIAETLESGLDRPGWFSFEPGPGAVQRIAGNLERHLAMPGHERNELRIAVSDLATSTWSWPRTAELLLEAALRHPA